MTYVTLGTLRRTQETYNEENEKDSHQRDLQKRPIKETYKRNLQKRPIKETSKRDL